MPDAVAFPERVLVRRTQHPECRRVNFEMGILGPIAVALASPALGPQVRHIFAGLIRNGV